jgi:formate-dependent phosphoribosylglycinamide formyltransferase (GAR transformylase)
LLVEKNLERLQNDLDELEPKDRIKFILEMARFILPTLQAVSVDDLRENEAQGFNVLTINLTTNGNDTDN